MIGRMYHMNRRRTRKRSDDPPWVQAVIYIVLIIALLIAADLLAPKLDDQVPAGLGDFDFPTATEGRAVPIVFGSVIITAPNVVWYGDLDVDPITITQGLLIRTTVTVGFKYRVGMHMAVCHGPVDEMFRIEVDDKTVDSTILTTGGTTVVIDEKDFAGKDDDIFGQIEFYPGVDAPVVISDLDSETSQYLADQLAAGVKADMVAYTNLCQVVWLGPSTSQDTGGLVFKKNGHLGNSQRVAAWNFHVRRFPNTLGLTGGKERIGDDANPIAVLYELLTNAVWGLGHDPLRVNTADFLVAADTVFTEANGFGMIWNSQRKARDLVTEIVKQVDATFYEDENGKFTVKLVRVPTGGELAAAITLDDSNVITVANFSRGAWNKTTNNVQVDFINRDDEYKKTSAVSMDMANFRNQDNEDKPTKQTYPGVKTAATAKAISARELAQQSYPLAVMELVCNREASGLQPGQIAFFANEDLGITSMVIRVLKVDIGTMLSGAVTVTAIQDIFGVASTVFANPPPTGWVAPVTDPVIATDEVAIQSPRWFSNIDGAIIQAEKDNRTYHLVGKPSQVSSGYSVFVAEDADTNPYEEIVAIDSLTPFTVTLGSLGLPTLLAKDATGFLISASGAVGFDIGLPAEDINANSEIVGGGLLYIEDGTSGEFVSYDTLVADTGNYRISGIRRGLLDTVPQTHASGANVWFVATGSAGSPNPYLDGQDIFVKHLPSVAGRRVDQDLVTDIDITFTAPTRSQRPIVVGNPRVGDVGSEIWAQTTVNGATDVRILFAKRDRLSPVLEWQDNADVTPVDTNYRCHVVALDQSDVALSGSPYVSASAGATSVDIPLADLVGVTTLKLDIYAVAGGDLSEEFHNLADITVT